MSDILIASAGIGNNDIAFLLIHPATVEDADTPTHLTNLAARWGLSDITTTPTATPAKITYNIAAEQLETVEGHKALDAPVPSEQWQAQAREYGAIGIFLTLDHMGTYEHFQNTLIDPDPGSIFYGVADFTE